MSQKFKTAMAAGLRSTRFSYKVAICGGTGPNVWDTEVVVEAMSLLDAAIWANEHANTVGGWVVMIEQED